MAASGEVDLEHQLAEAYGLDFCKVVTDLHQDELPLRRSALAGVAVPRRRDRQGRAACCRRRLRPHAGRLRRGPRREPAPHVRFVVADGRPDPHAPPPTRTRSSAASPSAPAPRPRSCRCRSWPTAPRTATSCSASRTSPRPSSSPGSCDLMLVGIGTTVAEAELVSTGMIEPAEMAPSPRRRRRRDARPFLRRARTPRRDRAHRSASSPSRSSACGTGAIVAVAGGTVKSRAPSARSSRAACSCRPDHRRAHRPRLARCPSAAAGRRRDSPGTEPPRHGVPHGSGNAHGRALALPRPLDRVGSPHNERRHASRPPPAPCGGGFDLVRILLEGRAFFALILIIIVFSILSPNYFSVANFLTMANHVAIYGLLSIGMLLVILNGGIDLSVGSVARALRRRRRRADAGRHASTGSASSSIRRSGPSWSSPACSAPSSARSTAC